MLRVKASQKRIMRGMPACSWLWSHCLKRLIGGSYRILALFGGFTEVRDSGREPEISLLASQGLSPTVKLLGHTHVMSYPCGNRWELRGVVSSHKCQGQNTTCFLLLVSPLIQTDLFLTYDSTTNA